VDAARDRERGAHPPGHDREPAEPQVELGGVREPERRLDLEALDVDVGLVEPVEEDEAVAPASSRRFAMLAIEEKNGRA
jgi:hypothetical protein